MIKFVLGIFEDCSWILECALHVNIIYWTVHMSSLCVIVPVVWDREEGWGQSLGPHPLECHIWPHRPPMSPCTPVPCLGRGIYPLRSSSLGSTNPHTGFHQLEKYMEAIAHAISDMWFIHTHVILTGPSHFFCLLAILLHTLIHQHNTSCPTHSADRHTTLPHSTPPGCRS